MDLSFGDNVSGDESSDLEVTFAGPTNTSVLYLNKTDKGTPEGVGLWMSDVLTPQTRYDIIS